MGWRERDWAAWSEQERARHLRPAAPARVPYRPSGVFVVAVLVELVISGGFAGVALRPRPAAPPQAARPAILYGSGLVGPRGSHVTCTAIGDGPEGPGTCTEWTVLMPGQHEVEAAKLPAGAVCRAAEVDQRTGRWVCIGDGSQT